VFDGRRDAQPPSAVEVESHLGEAEVGPLLFALAPDALREQSTEELTQKREKGTWIPQ
jgi:hypothetical protein